MPTNIPDIGEPPIPTEHSRPSWDEYFMEIGQAVSRRATCDRGRSGSVIVREKHILVTGYVGAPPGLPHCDEVGHLLKTVTHEDGSTSDHCLRTTHAEQNAIVQAAKLGIPIKHATIYCRMTPCRTCAQMIINADIRRVVCAKRYQRALESERMFQETGVQLNYFDESIEEYGNE